MIEPCRRGFATTILRIVPIKPNLVLFVRLSAVTPSYSMTYGCPLRLLLLEIVPTVKSTLPLEMRIPELSQLTTVKSD